MTQAQHTTGYRNKPIWIQVLATLLILAPFGNLIGTFWAMDLPITNPESWTYWVRYVPVRVWALNILLFVSGWALLKVRTWTHLLATGTLLCVLIYNIITFQSLMLLGPITLGIFILASGVMLGLLYSKDFRKPYFQPRLRWWETHPRYKARLSIVLKDLPQAKEYLGEILDISRSGTLIQLDSANDSELQVGEEHHLILPNKLELNAQIVRRTPEGYGFEFMRNSWSTRSDLKKFIRDLSSDPTRYLR